MSNILPIQVLQFTTIVTAWKKSDQYIFQNVFFCVPQKQESMSLERLFTFEWTVPLKEEDDEGRGTARVTGSRQGCWHNWSPNFTSASAEEMRTPQVYCPPILLPIPEEREGERERWKKKTEQNQQNKKAMCERDGRPAAGGNVEWEEPWGACESERADGFPHSALQHSSTVTLLRQAKGKHSIPLTHRVKAGQRGGVVWTSSFCCWNEDGVLRQTLKVVTGLKHFCLREKVFLVEKDWKGNGGNRNGVKD